MRPRKNIKTVSEATEYNVQGQFEDLTAQQLDLHSVMDE